MAAKHLSLLLLLTLLSSLHTHARDSQMFNKVPSKTNEIVVKETQVPNKEEPPLNSKEQEEPNFMPENENSYGLYGHDESSGQLPPSTTTPNNEPFKSNSNNFPYNAKYLPKNYNPVAYVTEPEDFNESSFEDKSYTTTTTPNKNNNNGYYNRVKNYYNGQQQQGMKGSEFMDREYTTPTNRNNYYNNAGNNYDVQQESMSDTRFMDRAYTTPTNNNNMNRFTDRTYTTPTDNNMNNLNNNNYNTGGRVNRVQPQGMSDTRFLENGRYYYDINAEKYSRDPYENSKEFVSRNQYNPRGYYGNKESMSDTRFMDRTYTTPTNNNMNNLNNNNYNTGGRVNRVQPQGMSDTRFLENGRYYYDINAEKYSRDPYENSKEFVSRNQYNPRGYYGNKESTSDTRFMDRTYTTPTNNNNYMEGQEQYHDEEDMP